jgi:hypothetical protein
MMTAPGFISAAPRKRLFRSGLSTTSFLRVCKNKPLNPETWEGAKRRNPPPGSLQAVGWKLDLASCQFLPSPEAPVVLIIVVDVVLERDDIEMALIEMARDNITGF